MDVFLASHTSQMPPVPLSGTTCIVGFRGFDSIPPHHVLNWDRCIATSAQTFRIKPTSGEVRQHMLQHARCGSLKKKSFSFVITQYDARNEFLSLHAVQPDAQPNRSSLQLLKRTNLVDECTHCKSKPFCGVVEGQN